MRGVVNATGLGSVRSAHGLPRGTPGRAFVVIGSPPKIPDKMRDAAATATRTETSKRIQRPRDAPRIIPTHPLSANRGPSAMVVTESMQRLNLPLLGDAEVYRICRRE